MRVFAEGICAFCTGKVQVEYTCKTVDEFLRATLQGRLILPGALFCSETCSVASMRRLDDQVNTAVSAP